MESIRTFTLEQDTQGKPLNPVSHYIFETVLQHPTLDPSVLQDFIRSTGLKNQKINISSDMMSKKDVERIKPYYIFSTILYKLLYTPELEALLKQDESLVGEFQQRVDLNITTLVAPFVELISEERKATEKAESRAKKAENKLSNPFAVLSPTPLENYAHNNTKVARYIHDGTLGTEIFPFEEETLFDVMKRDNLTSACTVSNEFYDTGYLEFSSKPPTPFDKEVYDAISSHYEVGNADLTVAMIYRAMTGKGSQQKPTPQQAGAITKSIKRMGALRVKIDCTEELKARGADIAYGKLDSIALDYRSIEGMGNNGKPFTYYQFKSEPVLFTYAKAVKQIVSIPMAYLDSPTNNSEDTMVVKKYILTRILNMKSPNNKLYQNTILLENIYVHTQAETKDQRRKARENAKKMLEFWQEQQLFSSYEFLKKGKDIYAIKIHF